jgi:hypothetical protein
VVASAVRSTLVPRSCQARRLYAPGNLLGNCRLPGAGAENLRTGGNLPLLHIEHMFFFRSHLILLSEIFTPPRPSQSCPAST